MLGERLVETQSLQKEQESTQQLSMLQCDRVNDLGALPVPCHRFVPRAAQGQEEPKALQSGTDFSAPSSIHPLSLTGAAARPGAVPAAWLLGPAGWAQPAGLCGRRPPEGTIPRPSPSPSPSLSRSLSHQAVYHPVSTPDTRGCGCRGVPGRSPLALARIPSGVPP